MTRTILSALMAAVTLASAAPTRAAEEQLVDGIAAQVGTRIVLVSEVLRTIAPQEASMRAQGAPPREIAKLRAEGLERMIEARLLEGVVAQSELYATDEEIDQTIDRIAEENGLTREQLEASVAYHGLTGERYRAQIKRDLERRNVVNAVIGSKITVDEAELVDYYEERFADQPEGGLAVHVRQILSAYGGPAERTPEQACGRAEEARAAVASGEDWIEVALRLSDASPRDGGDIGWLHMESVAEWMREAVTPLDVGEVSEVLELPFGCAVLELVERREFTPITYEIAKDRLMQELYEEKLEEGYREWIEQLREGTYIDRYGYFADAARFGESTFPVAPPEETPPIP